MGAIQTFNVAELQKTFNLSNFVETGTFKGDAIADLRGIPFSRFFSCEIEPTLFADCERRFAGDPLVEISNTNSVDFLERIKNLEGNCLFWLDAHFPGADAQLKRYDSEPSMDVRLPLQRELETLSSRFATHNDVFVIDDRWVYEDDTTIRSGLLFHHMLRHGQVEDLTSFNHTVGSVRDSKMVESLLSATHDVWRLSHNNGYYVGIPRAARSTITPREITL